MYVPNVNMCIVLHTFSYLIFDVAVTMHTKQEKGVPSIKKIVRFQCWMKLHGYSMSKRKPKLRYFFIITHYSRFNISDLGPNYMTQHRLN